MPQVWLSETSMVPQTTYERLLLPDDPPESYSNAKYWGRRPNRQAKQAMRNWLRNKRVPLNCTAMIMTDEGFKTPSEIVNRNKARITRLIWKRRQAAKQGVA